MRSLIRNTIVVGCSLVTATIWSGCKAKPATEYVAGLSTQVQVPRDLKYVRIDINVGGIPQASCQPYKVFTNSQNQTVVQLPRSLGAYPQQDSALNSGPLEYTIIGFTDDIDPNTNPIASICAQPKVGENSVRVLRRSRQPYIPEEIRFIPMPLKYSCFDKDCGPDQTCKGGKCVDSEYSLDQAKLAFPLYTPDLVDGTGGTCFSITTCLAAAAPPVVVDATNCIYAVPNTASAPPPVFGTNPFSGPSSGDGVNVEVTYDGGITREVLDKDPDEGFLIPDPANPQRFKLAPGLCEMLHGVDDQGQPTPHRISAIRASGTCQAKTIQQPICAGDMLTAEGADPNGVAKQNVGACSSTELKPPQASLIVIVDNTTAHIQFFTAFNTLFNPNETDPDKAQDGLVQPAINLALSDPTFERTSIGLLYDATPLACNGAAPDIVPELAATARDKIINSLKAEATVGQPVGVAGGLKRAIAELQKDTYKNDFRRAILVLGNGGFADKTQCGNEDPVALAAAAHANANQRIDTYVVQFTKDPPKSAAADALATAGGTNNPVTGLASAYRVPEAKSKFQDIVNSLGTCVYDITADVANAQPKNPATTDQVSFTNPLDINPATQVTSVPFNASCATAEGGTGTGPGWAYATDATNVPAGQKRIYLCKDTCAQYRTVVTNNAVFAGTYGQTPLPVPVFAYHASCTTP